MIMKNLLKIRSWGVAAIAAILAVACAGGSKGTVTIAVDSAVPQAEFAAGQLHDALMANG